MTKARTKKADDNDILALNSVGISLQSIGTRLGIHHTTVKARLTECGVEPVDTRRAFMEEIYDSLTEPQKEWLVAQLDAGRSIKDMVKGLIIKAYVSRTS